MQESKDKAIRVKMVSTKPPEPLDKGGGDAVVFGKVQESLTRQLPTNTTEGIKISDDVWSEWITVSKFLCLVRDDPDVYDLFTWIREELNGCQPLSDALIEKVDGEIARELGPWT